MYICMQWRHTLPKIKIYPQTKFCRHISHSTAEIKLLLVRKNKCLRYWNFFCCDFDDIAVIGVLFCIMLPNFIQFAPPAAEIWRIIDFQDGSRGGTILLPVSYLMMTLPSVGQSLSANQISSTYLNPRLRYNYFRFGKANFRHIGNGNSTSAFDFDNIA